MLATRLSEGLRRFMGIRVAQLTTHGVRRWPVSVCKHLPVLTQMTLTVWSPLRGKFVAISVMWFVA